MNYTDILIESILEESAKTDFIAKFGEDTFNNFVKAKQRLLNAGKSVDFGQYLKMTKKELDDLILSLYSKDSDAEKRRSLQGTKRDVRGKYKFYGEHDGYLVYEPLDYISSMDLGINTGWCTTGRYGHYGHPDFAPDAEAAQEHFDEYVNNRDIRLFYFLDPETFYGKYAIAYYPVEIEVEDTDENPYVYDKVNNRVIKLNSTRMEIFNAEDDNIWYEPTIMKIAGEVLGLETGMDYEETDYTVDDNGFDIDGNELARYFGTARDLVIPDTVSKIAAEAFFKCRSVQSITMPDSVTVIGEHAFDECSSLKSIRLSRSLTRIPYAAFAYCGWLDNVEIPEGVTYIGNDAFAECSALKNISLPSSLRTIDMFAFSRCVSLTSITIPEGCTTIDLKAFESCYVLKEVNILGSINNKCHDIFVSCPRLRHISFSRIPSRAALDGLGVDSSVKVDIAGTYNMKDYEKNSSLQSNGYYTDIVDNATGEVLNGQDVTVTNLTASQYGGRWDVYCDTVNR